MTRMTCSKDTWFVRGFGIHARMFTERNNTCCMVCWPHYFLFNVEKRLQLLQNTDPGPVNPTPGPPLCIYHLIYDQCSD